MPNDYYTVSGDPQTNSAAKSSTMRTVFANIASAFNKLPALSGNGNKIVAVNSGGTALESIATTGTGNAVRADSATLSAPVLGAATATSLNKVSITAPATGATITIADGKALTVSNTITLSGTDSASLDISDVVKTSVLGLSSGASLSGFIQSGAGAAAGTVQARLRESVSVRDFISTAIDGVTDNQAGIALAVAEAYSRGAILVWPTGTYVSSANITNFHSVRHAGAGIIKRGSNLFYVEPINNQTSDLFVSTAGSATNDGLSSSQPLSDISVQTILYNCNTLQGQWNINYAAGTYTRGIFLRGIKSRNRINFTGPNVGGHPNVPTAIFDGATSSEQAAFFFQLMNIEVQNVKCQNFTSSPVGYGVCADEASSMLTVNVHTTGNQYAGICADDGSVVRVKGGIHNANVFYGLRAHDNSMVTFGYQGDAVSNRPVISNNPIGIAMLTGAQGHIDFCDISGSSQYGVTVEDCSRVHIAGSTLATNTLADVRLNGLSSWYNDPATTNTFSSTTLLYENNVTSAQSLSGYVTTQFDKTSSASYANVPGLSITLEAGFAYLFHALLSVTSGASGGISCALGGTATASSVMAVGRVYNSSTLANSQKTISRTGAAGSYTGVATDVEISGTIVCSAAGTFTIRFAQNVSDAGTSSVLVNSKLTATRIK